MRSILILGCLVLVMVIAPSEGYKWPWATGTAEAKSESEEEVQTGLVTVKKPQGKPKTDQSKDKSEGKPADPNPAKPQDKVKPDSNDKENKSGYKHAVPEETKPADPNPAKPQDKVKPDSIDKENKKSEYKHAVPTETKPADPKSETKPADPKPTTPPTKDVDSKISKDTEKIATASALALAAMAAAEKNSYGGLYQGKKPESVAKLQTSLVKQQPSQDKPKTDSNNKKPESKPTDTNMITPVVKVDPKVPTDPKTVAVASAATLAAAATQKKPSRGFFWSKKPKDSSESDEIPTGLVKQKPKTASNGKPTEQPTTPPAIKVDPKILKDPKALAAVAAGTTAVAAAQKKIDENNKKMSQMKKKIKLEDELNIKDRDASLSDLNLDVIRKSRPKIRWTLAAYAFVNLILFVAQYAGSIITPPIGRVIYGLDFAMKKLARAPVNNIYAKYVTENADYGLRYLEKHEDVRGSLKVGKVLRITSHDGHMTPVKILRMSKEDQIDPKLLNFVDKSVWEQLQEVYGKI